MNKNVPWFLREAVLEIKSKIYELEEQLNTYYVQSDENNLTCQLSLKNTDLAKENEMLKKVLIKMRPNFDLMKAQESVAIFEVKDDATKKR